MCCPSTRTCYMMSIMESTFTTNIFYDILQILFLNHLHFVSLCINFPPPPPLSSQITFSLLHDIINEQPLRTTRRNASLINYLYINFLSTTFCRCTFDIVWKCLSKFNSNILFQCFIFFQKTYF